RSVDCYAINTEFQALLESRADNIQVEDVGETEINKDVDKVVLDNVEEQKDSVAQVVNESPQDSVFSVPVGVITNVTGYFGRIKREMLCDTSCMQDVYLSLEVDKENFANLFVMEDGIGFLIEERVNIEVPLAKSNKHSQQSSDLGVALVAENFEWKLGLESWNGPLMARVELHHKYNNGSLMEHYLGISFTSSRSLQGVIDDQPHLTVENKKTNMSSDMIWYTLQCLKVKETENKGLKVHQACMVKCVKAMARRGNCFQENVKVLFGLNNEILQVKKDWKAH
nr:hypothetical protein [Tanacetum cinerariifolium]